MANEKSVDLNARIFQGYDPNTEFKENGNILSMARFSDQTEVPASNLLNALKGNIADINNSLRDFFTDSQAGGNIPSLNGTPAGSVSGNTGINLSNPAFFDILSDGASGGLEAFSLQGIGALGAGAGSPTASHGSLAFVKSINGSNTPATPGDPVVDPESYQLKAPVVSVNGSITLEGDPIPLTIGLTADPTAGVVTTVTITGIPSDATLSAGILNSDGTWTLTPAQLTGLILTPPAHYSGDITLSVIATSSLNGMFASDTENFKLTVEGDASPPILNLQDASGSEDTVIALNISSSLTDTDGSEILSIAITGVPAGAVLSAGTNNGGGNWTLTPAQLTGLTITPPANYSGTIALTVDATSSENGTVSTVSHSLNVVVAGIADMPTLSVQNASGGEHLPIALTISSALTDTDGSETLSITIYNVPTGAVLSAGVDNGDNSWTLTQSQLAGLTITPPANYSGSFNLDVLAVSSENATSAYAVDSLTVTVAGIATPPTITTAPASGNEDTAIALTINPALVDNDGSETLSITITGVPSGALLSAGTNNGGGSWTLTPAQLAGLTITPPLNYSGNFDLTVTATSTENATTANSASILTVSVAGVPDTPTLHVNAAYGDEHTPIPLDITSALTDTDGSETLSITITGVPLDAILSAGTNNGGGSWTLTPAQLAGLTITPAANYNGTLNLSVIATASENSLSASTPATAMSVIVSSVVGAPNVATYPATGNEDTGIPIHIDASPNDPMGTEVLTIIIANVPMGSTLSAGIDNGDGSWTLTLAELTGLTLTPAANYSGNFDLAVTVVSTDNGISAQVSAPLSVSIAGVPDLPTLNVSAASGNENTAIPLSISSALTDTDGSETLSITVTGVPTGATLSAGTNNGGGSWTLTSAQLAGLTLTPAAGYSGNFNLGVIATSSENLQSISTGSSTLAVSVNGIALAPNLSVHAVSGNEDTAIALGITAGLVDTDGSETLSITITGVPPGASLSAGTDNGGGSWTLTPAQLAGLTITPPANFSGAFSLSVTATSSENSTTAQTSHALPVTVTGVADTPTLSVSNATGLEDGHIALNITAGLTDTDGSEVLSIVVAGIPTGAYLSAGLNNGDGTWTLSPAELSGLTFTPPLNYAGIIALQVSAISTENNGDSVSLTAPVTVTVTPQADAPSLNVTAASGREDTAISLSISSLLGDTDGSESLSIVITGVPTGASLSTGVNNGGGSWTLTQNQLVNLKITPPLNSDADFILLVTATSTDSNGHTSSIIQNLPVTVLGSADTPTVTASNTTGAVNTAVNVTISGAVTDASESLTYLISGVPDGFSLNHGINNGDNTWSLTTADLTGLKIISPYNFEGRVFMTAQSLSHDSDNSTAQSLAANFNVGIGNASNIQLNLGLNLGVLGIGVNTALGVDVNLGGLLSPGGIVVHEDSVFPLLDAGLLVTLASGISFLTFNLPVGASLNSGTDLGGGAWRILPGDLANLSLTLPPNSDQDFVITITAKLLVLTVTLATVNVHVLGVADTPTLSVANATGNEDATSIPISVTSALTDTDGSETLSFMIKDLPAGFIPTVGIDNGNGTWSLTAAEIASLAIKPAANFSGDATYTIVAVSTEREGDSTIHTETGHIHVNAVADAPTITPGTNSGTEDSPLTLNLGIALTDTDGSESISAITISGLAAGFSLTGATNNGDGTWSVNPANAGNVHMVAPANWSGDTSFSVSATSKEGASGPTATTTTTVNAHFEAVADAPNASAQNVTGLENHAITLNVSASLNDTDGSEHLSAVISNVPHDFIFSSGLNNGDGSWSFTASQLVNLTVTPETDFTGDAHMSLDVFSEDSNHTIATTHADFTVHVNPDI